jgi:outer membrane lipoprotein-sorting protein
MSMIYPKLTITDVDKLSSTILGYKINPANMKVTDVWKLNFQNTGEELVTYASDDQLSSDEYQGYEENNGNIMYKYVDPNLMAVVTYAAPSHLNVYIVNRANGTIIYSGHIYNAYGKDNIKIYFSENTIIVTYLKKYVRKLPYIVEREDHNLTQ